jgi:hypothetical protein
VQNIHEDRFWLREDLSIADELLLLAPKLREEYLNYHKDFNGEFSKGKFYDHKFFNINNMLNKNYAWKQEFLKYTGLPHKRNSIPVEMRDNYYLEKEMRERYPTAVALTEKYGEDCPISTYSVLEANTIIYRHSGAENRDSKFIRIHIPLIIPEGDCFFECEGYEIDWSDIWAFNTQRIHSAHNLTNHRRLVFIIDITRDKLGIKDSTYSIPKELMKNPPPFVRGTVPKVCRNN